MSGKRRPKRRKDGLYQKSFIYHGDKKRKYVYSSKYTDLDQKIVEKIKELDAKAAAKSNPTLNEYYQHFTKVREHEIKESTLRSQDIQYRAIATLKDAGQETFGEKHIRDITRQDIESIRLIMEGTGKSARYINNCFAHLNHVFNTAVLDDVIEKNPCKALKPLKRDRPPVSNTRHRALAKEEIKRFFDVAKSRNSFYLNAYEVLIKTGMRLGELTALYPADIGKDTIHIRRTITRNAAGGYEVGEDTKTESGARDIPLTSDVKTIIEQQIALDKSIYGSDVNGLIFRSLEGDILREYTLNREIKRICVDAGIEYFTCHAFRNTYATMFIEQRPQDYKVLSELLGHKDIGITLNLYTHVMQDRKQEAANAVKIDI